MTQFICCTEPDLTAGDFAIEFALDHVTSYGVLMSEVSPTNCITNPNSSLQRIAQSAPSSPHVGSDQAAAVSYGRDESLSRSLTSREDVTLWSALYSTHNDVIEVVL